LTVAVFLGQILTVRLTISAVFLAAPTALMITLSLLTISAASHLFAMSPVTAAALPKAGGTMTGALTVNAAAVFNETSADVDFRVESNSEANMLFVDGGENRIGIDTNGSIYKNLVALFKLRNAFIHYNPETIEHYKWPSKLIEAYKVLKIEKKEYNTNWVNEFCTIKIADWAENTIKSSIYEFCTKANSVNPFELPYPFNWDEESKTED